MYSVSRERCMFAVWFRYFAGLALSRSNRSNTRTDAYISKHCGRKCKDDLVIILMPAEVLYLRHEWSQHNKLM